MAVASLQSTILFFLIALPRGDVNAGTWAISVGLPVPCQQQVKLRAGLKRPQPAKSKARNSLVRLLWAHPQFLLSDPLETEGSGAVFVDESRVIS